MSAPTELTHREIALSVLKDLRAQALHNRDLTEADLALLIAEYDYYQERIDTWTEPRPEVVELEEALEAMRVELNEVRQGYHALDKNWHSVHEAALGAIRKAVKNPDATVAEIVALIEWLTAERDKHG